MKAIAVGMPQREFRLEHQLQYAVLPEFIIRNADESGRDFGR